MTVWAHESTGFLFSLIWALELWDITVDPEFLCNKVAMPRSVMKETVAKYKPDTRSTMYNFKWCRLCLKHSLVKKCSQLGNIFHWTSPAAKVNQNTAIDGSIVFFSDSKRATFNHQWYYSVKTSLFCSKPISMFHMSFCFCC